MAGVSASTRDQLVALLGVRRQLALRQFRGRPNEGWLTLAFLLIAVPLPVLFAVLSGAAYRRLSGEAAAELLGLVLAALWASWLFLPAMIGSLNDSIDLSRLIMLPIRRTALIGSLIVGTVFDFSTLFSGPVIIAAWIAWTRGPVTTWLLVALAIFAAYAHMVIAGQLTTTLIAGIARSRRFRDWMIVLGSVVGLGLWVLEMNMTRGHLSVGRRFVQAVESGWHPLGVLQWLPPGACARSIHLASTGAFAAATAWLAYATLWLGGITAVWWRLLTYVTLHGGFLSAGRRSATGGVAHAAVQGDGWLDRWWPPATAALVRTDLRVMWRAPRRRVQTLQGVLMPLVFGWFWFHAIDSTTALTFVPAFLVCFVGLFVYQNAVGDHGTGVATVFLSPLRRERFFQAKNISFAVLALAPAVVSCGFVIARIPPVNGLTSVLLCLGLFLVFGAVAPFVAIAAAAPVKDDGRRAVLSGSAASGLLTLVVEPIGVALLWAPIWIPVVIALATGRDLAAVIVAALGIPYGAVVLRFGTRRAGRVLLGREADLFLRLDLNKSP